MGNVANAFAYSFNHRLFYRGIASSDSVAWGTTHQKMEGYTEVTSSLIEEHAPFFDHVYQEYGFIGKAEKSPFECAIVLADRMAVRFKDDGWMRVARKEKCTFNWGSGAKCQILQRGTHIRFATDLAQIVNYPALITRGFNNNDCRDKKNFENGKIFQNNLKFEKQKHWRGHSIFIRNGVKDQLDSFNSKKKSAIDQL